MVVQGSPTKIVHKTETETEIKSKETFEACSQDSDTDFTVETEELEALEVSDFSNCQRWYIVILLGIILRFWKWREQWGHRGKFHDWGSKRICSKTKISSTEGTFLARDHDKRDRYSCLLIVSNS